MSRVLKKTLPVGQGRGGRLGGTESGPAESARGVQGGEAEGRNEALADVINGPE